MCLYGRCSSQTDTFVHHWVTWSLSSCAALGFPHWSPVLSTKARFSSWDRDANKEIRCRPCIQRFTAKGVSVTLAYFHGAASTGRGRAGIFSYQDKRLLLIWMEYKCIETKLDTCICLLVANRYIAKHASFQFQQCIGIHCINTQFLSMIQCVVGKMPLEGR